MRAEAQTASARATPSRAPLLSLLERDAPGRATVRDLEASGIPGRRHYIAALAMQCMVATSPHGPLALAEPNPSRVKPEDLVRANLALRRLERVCSGFTADDLVRLSGLRERDAVDAADPLEQLHEQLLMLQERSGSVSSEERTAVLRALFADPDPVLLSQTAIAGIFRHQVDGREVMMFGGRTYRGMSEGMLLTALQRVPCSFGLRCDDSDLEVSIACASGSGCAARRRGFPADPLATPELEAQVEALARDISDAIRRADLQPFLKRP